MSDSYGKLFKDGLWENNVVFSQMLALCPTMAVTTELIVIIGVQRLCRQ